SEREMRRLRGSRMAMIFQDPLTTLNPVLRIGHQVVEVIRVHADDMADECRPLSRREAWERGVEVLARVGIPSPEERMKSYPHEMSGGMRQRVMIAIALACNPSLLIADEPTTALDVTIQAQILDLMASIRDQFGTSILLITHDFGVVSEFCHRVMVMYAGKGVEYAPLDELLTSPRHSYSQGLLESVPRIGERHRKLKPIEGIVPELHNLPPGCRYATRCPLADDLCRAVEPELVEAVPGHWVACHKAEGVQGSRTVPGVSA